jgi:hypothetical protein
MYDMHDHKQELLEHTAQQNRHASLLQQIGQGCLRENGDASSINSLPGCLMPLLWHLSALQLLQRTLQLCCSWC